MSRIRQRSHAPATSLATEQRRQVREIARREFNRDGHTVPRHVLSRGEIDPYSELVNTGLPADKLKEEVLSDALLLQRTNRRNYHGNGPDIRTLPTDFTLLQEHLVGEVVKSGNIEGRLPPAKLPNDVHYGKVKRGNIENDLNADKLIKDGTLPVSALASRPWPTGDEFKKLQRRVKALEGKKK